MSVARACLLTHGHAIFANACVENNNVSVIERDEASKKRGRMCMYTHVFVIAGAYCWRSQHTGGADTRSSDHGRDFPRLSHSRYEETCQDAHYVSLNKKFCACCDGMLATQDKQTRLSLASSGNKLVYGEGRVFQQCCPLLFPIVHSMRNPSSTLISAMRA
jgi:hypothetical protein